jgi:hypothetical protein
MNTLREMGKFVGMAPPVSLRTIGNYVISHGTPISMRAVIQRLQSLPPLILEADVDRTQGEVPFDVTLHVKTTGSGLVLHTHVRILQAEAGGGVFSGPFAWTGGAFPFNFWNPGTYVIEVTRTGITSTGYTQLKKTFPISAWPKATRPPDPPPPLGKPSISVQANGDGSFVVSGKSFSAQATVHIRVVDGALGTTVFFTDTATSAGELTGFKTGKICQRAGQLFFSANDERSDPQDHTGTLWSNTITTTCSA